jgi:MFS family permease
MHIVDLLFMSCMAIGAALGGLLGYLLVTALHSWLPGAYSPTLGAFILGTCVLIGAYVGSRFDLPSKSRRTSPGRGSNDESRQAQASFARSRGQETQTPSLGVAQDMADASHPEFNEA